MQEVELSRAKSGLKSYVPGVLSSSSLVRHLITFLFSLSVYEEISYSALAIVKLGMQSAPSLPCLSLSSTL